MNRRGWIGSFLLLAMVVAAGVGLAGWKYSSIQETFAASANQPEPMETVTVVARHMPAVPHDGRALESRRKVSPSRGPLDR